MARTPKKLCQGALNTAVTIQYTAPVNTTAQVVEIWLVNTNTTTARKIALYAHGTASSNIILQELEIPPMGTKVIDQCKIILNTGEVLAVKQDVGSDVIITAYGVESTN